MTITYQLGDKLYLNITNKCQCACEFCVRTEADGVGDGENLWLEHEPAADEVIADLKKRNMKDYCELVFCGFGEPTENLDVMLKICRWLKENQPEIPVRLNTNGLAVLSAKKPVAPLLEGMIDTISISLNAPNPERYHEITHSVFGLPAFHAMLEFAEDSKEYIPNMIFSVVDVLSPDEIADCRKIADGMGIPLRVREMI